MIGKSDNNEMDVAAEAAGKELDLNFEKWSARQVAHWWDKWYGKAGHKRLAKLLLSQISGEFQ